MTANAQPICFRVATASRRLAFKIRAIARAVLSPLRYFVRRLRRSVAVLADVVRKQGPHPTTDRLDSRRSAVDAPGGRPLGRKARRLSGLSAFRPCKLYR